jgi:hypothetical protein
MSNVLIEAKGQGNLNQQMKSAVIVHAKDIRRMLPTTEIPVQVRTANKENVKENVKENGSQKKSKSKF